MTKEQKETELTPEMEKYLIHKHVLPVISNPEKLVMKKELFIKALQAIKKETEQSLKQKVEKMLEGMKPQARVEDLTDLGEYKLKTLEEAKNNLEDL